MESDAELLDRYVEGDARAMDRLVDRHAGTVYAFVARFLGDPGAAEDLTQEVWLRVLRGAGSFDRRARFTTWLFAVARNACLDHLRARRRRTGPDGAPDAPLPEITDPAPPIPERVAHRELERLVAAAVRELPDAQREVFLLREQTDLSFTEIARVLELPRETVKSRMRYALEHLRRALRAPAPRRSARDSDPLPPIEAPQSSGAGGVLSRGATGATSDRTTLDRTRGDGSTRDPQPPGSQA